MAWNNVWLVNMNKHPKFQAVGLLLFFFLFLNPYASALAYARLLILPCAQLLRTPNTRVSIPHAFYLPFQVSSKKPSAFVQEIHWQSNWSSKIKNKIYSFCSNITAFFACHNPTCSRSQESVQGTGCEARCNPSWNKENIFCGPYTLLDFLLVLPINL